MAAIGAALTRRLTLIQGPPGKIVPYIDVVYSSHRPKCHFQFLFEGTGKTTVAASIAFGYVHQCRSSKNLPAHSKVLATAFSNVGADNIAEQLLRLGLKVVRVGKASAVSKALWDHTLDAAIERDPEAKKALEDAARATSNLRDSSARTNKKGGSRSKVDIASERNKRELATSAVKASIEVSSKIVEHLPKISGTSLIRNCPFCLGL